MQLGLVLGRGIHYICECVSETVSTLNRRFPACKPVSAYPDSVPRCCQCLELLTKQTSDQTSTVALELPREHILN